MVKERFIRHNSRYLPWARAAAFAAVTAILLLKMPFYPTPFIALAVIGTGALAFATPSLAALLFVGIIALPILAANFVVGALFLILGFSATQYLGADHAKGFLVIMLLAVALPFHAEWAVIVLSGYLLGSAQGAIAALLACLLLQATGALLGLHDLGSLVVGGSGSGVLWFGPAPQAPFAFGWLAPRIAEANPGSVLASITAAKPVAALVAQPLLWGFGAALGGIFHRPHTGTARLTTAAGIGGITVILAAGSTVALTALGGAPSLRVMLLAGVVSTVIAVIVTTLTEWAFGLKMPETPAPTQASTHGVRAEDADVDELLRMISSAEDALVTRHTSSAVVMLTDMKSFSRMTEEVGSMASAKLVQRQRDLLLPIIDKYQGHGKSTGGDGLVAAFGRAQDAVDAAIAMQRAVTALCDAGASGGSLAIRIGIAQGEVVLDKGGRPFIGAALNLAARVMDLADGGRIMVTDETVNAAGIGDEIVHRHGSFDLKNIQKPVGVTEILWCDNQQPQDIASL